jgi:hypothetical protein
MALRLRLRASALRGHRLERSFSAPGRPGLRFGNALLAVWLLIEAILMPHVSLGTMLHDIFIGMLLSSVVIFTSGRWPKRTQGQAPTGAS